MGYYTNFTLVIEKGAEGIEDQIVEKFRQSNESAKYALGKTYGSGGQECKWYDSKNDLVEFSKKHPEVVFKLRGEGEEYGDIWELYVQNGKSQRCSAKIIFETFNPTKLA